MTHRQRADLTFKDNRKRGRHGWVRLTPAYSVKIVHQLLDQHREFTTLLDPFSGTGTTGLVATQRGLRCDLFDINPFLIWLARVKCASYTSEDIDRTRCLASEIIDHARNITDASPLWVPPISNIERWWSPARLTTLARVFHAINYLVVDDTPVKDLLLVAFCRLVIQWSNAAFNHQSMSFNDDNEQLRLFDETDEIYQVFANDVEMILASAAVPVSGTVRVIHGDSRMVTTDGKYDAVITSPPYVNRMSYIRELRPYMFWLGYLTEAREAGELDWQAIGGTWGIATSRLKDWTEDDIHSDIPRLRPLLDAIAQSSKLLSHYVHKYFTDMSAHFSTLYDHVADGGRLFYIVGNSKFYDTLVPAEQILVDLMQKHRFQDTHVEAIRKRNSKKELYEYLISARKAR